MQKDSLFGDKRPSEQKKKKLFNVPEKKKQGAQPENIFSDELVYETKNRHLFSPEKADAVDEKLSKLKVLIVDDEEDIHSVTRLALKTFHFDHKNIKFISAFSAEEAKQVLRENDDIAVVLLDVVMETNDAGLQLVKFIREELQDRFIRIVLRTGQPGQAPEREVIRNYEIDDYKTKTELTKDKLFTLVLASMRTYEAMKTVESCRRNLEGKVRERTRELEEANATKDKFFSIIAHDLKNPLMTIMGFSDILTEYYESFSEKEIRENIDAINNSSTQLHKLLENLLQWARSQTGNINFNPELLSLKLIEMENFSLFLPMATAKGIKIYPEVEKNAVVYADREMITTIIRNLLSNAIKFTPKDGEITIKSETTDEFVEISIIDSGIGISEEDVEKLFRIDVHHTTLGTSEERGTGLGLILCKEFVEKHGGKIWVESEVGKGSAFKFTLPQEDGKIERL
jgi:signal transduction histidine kinase